MPTGRGDLEELVIVRTKENLVECCGEQLVPEDQEVHEQALQVARRRPVATSDEFQHLEEVERYAQSRDPLAALGDNLDRVGCVLDDVNDAGRSVDTDRK